jgi:isopentenyl diphosphate isomerase/L-lactate dehydrogenase-like FMN-dependent dehydrogenase
VSPIRVLPEVVEARDDVTVMMDSGIRRGNRRAEGARARREVRLGGAARSTSPASVGGQAGVAHAIELPAAGGQAQHGAAGRDVRLEQLSPASTFEWI